MGIMINRYVSATCYGSAVMTCKSRADHNGTSRLNGQQTKSYMVQNSPLIGGTLLFHQIYIWNSLCSKVTLDVRLDTTVRNCLGFGIWVITIMQQIIFYSMVMDILWKYLIPFKVLIYTQVILIWFWWVVGNRIVLFLCCGRCISTQCTSSGSINSVDFQ